MRSVVASVLLAALAAGCVSAAPAQPSAGPSPAGAAQPTAAPMSPAGSRGVGSGSEAPQATLPPLSAWQAEVANLEPDGTRSVESALRLFAMAFGPIPGVDVATAERGTVGSASPAVRAVMAVRDQLTDEQRAAIDAHLEPPADAVTIDIPSTTSLLTAGAAGLSDFGGGTALDQPEDPLERDLLQLGMQARLAAARYFGEIPDTPQGKPAVSIRLVNHPSEPYLTLFNPVFFSGQFDHCDVFVNRAAVEAVSKTGRPLTLDVVHCYQSWKLGTDQGFDGNVPAWAWEGPAEYITLEAFPAQEDDALYWATYLLLPDVSLFERSYDAIGVYAQAWEAGIDLGDAFTAVLTDVDNPERFALAGLTSGAFLDKWASEHLRMRRGDWGADWAFLGPQLNTYSVQTPLQPITVANGSMEAFSQEAYSNHLFAVSSAADVVIVEGMGRVRIGDGAVDVAGGGIFCTTPKGCGPCPDGSNPSVDPTQLAAESVLAVSGGTDGTSGTVSGHPLEEFCQPSPPPSPDPTGDEFCKRYKQFLAWQLQHADTEYELTQPWAAEIARQMQELRPYAPPQLVEHVDLYIRVYGTYASQPEPINVPIVGPEAAGIATAFMAMTGYCGISGPGDL